MIGKAVAKVLKWELTAEERNDVVRYAFMPDQAYDGDGLAVALRGLLDATHRLKEA